MVISWPGHFISFYVDKVSSGLKLNAPKLVINKPDSLLK